MHRFEVWAPLAKKLAVQVDGVAVPMQGPDEHGGWRAEVKDAHRGLDYGFLIDDDPQPYPDPRSLWQPSGVHGLSRVFDRQAHPWNDAGWKAPPLASAVIYEMHVGTFTAEGTLDAAIVKLDHLVELGVTHLELMPVCAFAGDRGWGYDGVALFAVHEPYGGPGALKRFVDAMSSITTSARWAITRENSPRTSWNRTTRRGAARSILKKPARIACVNTFATTR
jgi:maltooligosyltrehalose trehalohydrolase